MFSLQKIGKPRQKQEVCQQHLGGPRHKQEVCWQHFGKPRQKQEVCWQHFGKPRQKQEVCHQHLGEPRQKQVVCLQQLGDPRQKRKVCLQHLHQPTKKQEVCLQHPDETKTKTGSLHAELVTLTTGLSLFSSRMTNLLGVGVLSEMPSPSPRQSSCIMRRSSTTSNQPAKTAQFSSVYDGIYVLRKAHMRSTTSSRHFPGVAFETVPMWV